MEVYRWIKHEKSMEATSTDDVARDKVPILYLYRSQSIESVEEGEENMEKRPESVTTT